MRVCFPTTGTNGLSESLYGHFGSAPYFTIVDIDNRGVKCIANANQIHEHGSCNPTQALQSEQVDAVVVQGIGAGAVQRLNALGVQVYRSQAATVADAVEAFAAKKLLPVNAAGTCNHNHTH